MELTGTINKNSLTILLLGVLVGAGMYLNLICSLSWLLSKVNPLYAVYMHAVAYCVYVLFFKFLMPKSAKFARFLAYAAMGYILVMSVLLYEGWPEEWRLLLWYSMAVFGISFFKGAMFKMTSLHLNPAVAQVQVFYNYRAYEVGTLMVVVLLVLVFPAPQPSHVIAVVMGIMALFACVLAVRLCPYKNIEVNIDHKHQHESIAGVPAFKDMARVFMLVLLIFGCVETFAGYAVHVYLRDNLVTYEKIVWVITIVYLASSVILIMLSSLIAYGARKFRPSPINMFFIHLFLIASASAYCLSGPSIFAFAVLNVVLLISQRSFHLPATQMIIASFPALERRFLSLLNIKYAFAVPSLLVAAILTFALYMKYEGVSHMVLVLVLLCTVAGWALLAWFHAALVEAFYYNIRLDHKGAAVLAAQALSYLNPVDYKSKMLALLEENPKKLLRKMIIIGLGYKGDQNVTDHLRKQFESDKEEVQLSVLDALSHCKDFANVGFVIEVLLGKHLTRSVNVRISAAKILAGLYGKRAIPILLYGLRENDPRIQANALETLSLFNNKKLFETIKPFAESPTPRVRANALMALSRFSKGQEIYRQGITEMLTSNDEAMMSSALYVIGTNRDKYFLGNVLMLLKLSYQEKPGMKRILAFTLTCLRNEKGYILFEELFNTPYHAGTQEDFVHLFAQLDYVVRFDVLEYLIRKHREDSAFRDNIYQHLKNASFDFHEEIDYLFA